MNSCLFGIHSACMSLNTSPNNAQVRVKVSSTFFFIRVDLCYVPASALLGKVKITISGLRNVGTSCVN